MHSEKPLSAIVNETVQFVATRAAMLMAEMHEKSQTIKLAIPGLCVAVAFLLAGWLSLTFGLIALLHSLFLPSIYAWLWAGLIVGAVYMVVGLVIGRTALEKLKATSLIPERTLTVLKQDQVWIQNEARAA
ncbi:MAG TPA: phage holin family protein [Candidatus Angelobacter sp.]|nr:phage holin family protein [Candidatus Angelobacter sp.]